MVFNRINQTRKCEASRPAPSPNYPQTTSGNGRTAHKSFSSTSKADEGPIARGMRFRAYRLAFSRMYAFSRMWKLLGSHLDVNPRGLGSLPQDQSQSISQPRKLDEDFDDEKIHLFNLSGLQQSQPKTKSVREAGPLQFQILSNHIWKLPNSPQELFVNEQSE